MQGSSVDSASSVIAPQRQTLNAYIFLVDDDDDYDERGISVCNFLSFHGTPKSMTLRFDICVGSIRARQLPTLRQCVQRGAERMDCVAPKLL